MEVGASITENWFTKEIIMLRKMKMGILLFNIMFLLNACSVVIKEGGPAKPVPLPPKVER